MVQPGHLDWTIRHRGNPFVKGSVPHSHSGPADGCEGRGVGRTCLVRHADHGLRIYEWQPTTLHAKTFVVDGEWVTIGSMNFDNRSLPLNDEATLMVLDPTIGRQMDRVFLDDLRYSEEITLAGFRQRSWLERIAERASSLVGRLL